MAHTTSHQEMMDQCIQECLNCHRLCLQTIQHCLRMSGMHEDPVHIGLLIDCAEICQTSANFMINRSGFHSKTCGLCAEICLVCEEDCRAVGRDDEVMRACADTCRRCAELCRTISSQRPDTAVA